MVILLTNDDGIDSPSFPALEQAFSDHEVYVVAPDRERSGQSHAITLKGPLRLKELAPRRWRCDGTPADCVLLALKGDFVPKPDLILSGLNLGPNLGTDLIYSGTAAAARQASLYEIPALAGSLAQARGPWDPQPAAHWLKDHLEELLALWRPGTFLNLNFPVGVALRDWRPATLGRRLYLDRIESFLAPGHEHYCFVRGALGDLPPEEGSDIWTVNRGLVSVSLVMNHPQTGLVTADGSEAVHFG